MTVRPQRNPFVVIEQSIDTAERSLLDAIASGDLDDHLDALAAAVGARPELLHTVRSVTRLMSVWEGDLVRINQRISPRYLAGLHGTVVDVDHAAATVQLARPVGRFAQRPGARPAAGARQALARSLTVAPSEPPIEPLIAGLTADQLREVVTAGVDLTGDVARQGRFT